MTVIQDKLPDYIEKHAYNPAVILSLDQQSVNRIMCFFDKSLHQNTMSLPYQ